MYILLQQGSKILVPYGDKNGVLIPYDNSTEAQNMKDWLERRYDIKILNLETKNNFTVATVDGHYEFYDGKKISYTSAIKQLPPNELGTEVKTYLEKQKMRIEIKLKYALKDGKIISINEVTEEEKGLKCDCYCPGCGMQLQAKLGSKRQKHFSHNNASCDIVSAQQSALHILAKEIIEQEKHINLPALEVKSRDIEGFDNELCYEFPEVLTFKQSTVVDCEKVILEKKISDFVPDVMVQIQGRMLLIEVAVTHFIDDEKLCKIKQLGIPVIEIDLSDIHNSEWNREDVKRIIVDDIDKKTWIYNPLKDKAMLWATEKYKIYENEQKEERLREKKRAEEKEKQRQENEEKAKKLIEKIIRDNEYGKIVMSLRDDVAFKNCLTKRSFYKVEGEIPFFIDIPISGEIVFECDRRIWQSAIFDKFVYNRTQDEDEYHSIHTSRISSWIKNYQTEFKVNWTMARKVSFKIGNELYSCNWYSNVIKKYLLYLYELGFVSKLSYSECDIFRSHTVKPPNSIRESLLKSILERVDGTQYNIDDQISKLLNPQNVSNKSMLYLVDDDDDEETLFMEEQKIRLQQIKETNELKYNKGLLEITSGDIWETQNIVKDSFGYRWFVCEKCGLFKRDDEMAFYQQKTGVCRECNRK